MTAVAASAITLRVSGWIWFVLGALAAVATLQATPISTTETELPLLINATCSATIALVSPDGDHKSVTLRGPGVYRLSVAATEGLTIGTNDDQRPTDEFPITVGGELSMPTEWCAPVSGFMSPGLGSGIPGS